MRGNKKKKYRDVVGKTKQKPGKKNIKKPRKQYSLFKKDQFKKHNGPKRTKEDSFSEEKSKKRKKYEEELVQKQEEVSEESDEEVEDHLKQLRDTLGVNSKKAIAIESDESESEGENVEAEEEDNVEEAGKEDDLEDVEDESEDSDSEQDTTENKEDEIQINLEEVKEDDDTDNTSDPFVNHLFYEIHDSLLESVQSAPIASDTFLENWPKLGNLTIQIPKCKVPNSNDTKIIEEKKIYAPPGKIPQRINLKHCTPSEIGIKSQIVGHLQRSNPVLPKNSEHIFTPLQNELFSIVNNYQDLYFTERTFDNSEEIRFVYCLHAVNHILKTRTKVLHHNARLSKKDEVPEDFRDQGLTRPKILIVLPFKDAAHKVVKMIIDILLENDKGNVIKKNRFEEDYTGNEIVMPKKNPKPEDYEQLFTGNVSDDFKMGITVTKKSLKLYADFYSSDIIIASPLGLRTIIGAEGESERDFDFLASIELLIFDQMDIFTMQNWDHILHVFNHLHLQPKDSHGTDFSRVRTWSLNGWAKYYRQTLIFSSIALPEINSIFNKKCSNYAGKVKTSNPIEFGTISQVVVQLPHVFHKFEASSVGQAIDARFDFFISKILPQQRDSLMKQTLIFVANYFDYVRLRNYFKREDIGFTQICEYSKEGKIARARDMFYHGDMHFMLYTERYHFFNRIRIKGIRHLVFYQLPNFPNFYPEICNLLQESNMNKKVGSISNMTVSVIYSKYDVHQLSAVVSTDRAMKMIQSDRNVQMMFTGSD